MVNSYNYGLVAIDHKSCPDCLETHNPKTVHKLLLFLEYQKSLQWKGIIKDAPKGLVQLGFLVY
jgi:hypothetical protein